MRHLLSVLAVFLVSLLATLASCRAGSPPARTAPEARIAIVATVPDADAPTTASTASPPSLGKPIDVGFAADGTLVVTHAHGVEAIAPAGAVSRLALHADNARVVTEASMEGILVQRGPEAQLYATPTLAPLTQSAGQALDGRYPALVPDSDRDTVFFVVRGGSKHLRVAAPSSGAVVEGFQRVAGGTRGLFSWQSEKGSGAVLFSLPGGERIASGFPATTGPLQGGPSTSVVGRHHYAIESSQLVERDLDSGRVLRRATFPCNATLGSGNLVVARDRALVFATCDFDGIVIDGKSFRLLRRIPRVVPGCDNGLLLDGHFDEESGALVVEGCGGEAHLDLRSGRYLCGDGQGILGASYAFGPGGQTPRAPAGRQGLPACSSSGFAQVSALGHSDRYRLRVTDRIEVLDGKRSVLTLPEDATMPSLSFDGSRMAYIDADAHVVVRALPGGNTLELP